MITTLYRTPVRSSISVSFDGVNVVLLRPTVTSRPSGEPWDAVAPRTEQTDQGAAAANITKGAMSRRARPRYADPNLRETAARLGRSK
jgi:hypothetical protein